MRISESKQLCPACGNDRWARRVFAYVKHLPGGTRQPELTLTDLEDRTGCVIDGNAMSTGAVTRVDECTACGLAVS